MAETKRLSIDSLYLKSGDGLSAVDEASICETPNIDARAVRMLARVDISDEASYKPINLGMTS